MINSSTSSSSQQDGGLQWLRVFTDENGIGGELLGVLLRDVAHAAEHHIPLRGVGCPVVVLRDVAEGGLEIYSQDGRAMSFSAHPVVGAGWLLAALTGRDIVSLGLPDGAVCSWRAPGGVQWISTDAHRGSGITLIEYEAPQEVDDLLGAPFGVDRAYCWAWQDELRYSVRARCFTPGDEVDEAEATGEAAVRLTQALGRAVAITQGRGAVLYAKPRGPGRVALGGRVAWGSAPPPRTPLLPRLGRREDQ